MRLWSIKPEYLDPIGLIALWRESILALRVLEGLTRGYRNHPQLSRFKNSREPLRSINTYIYYIWLEGRRRGYRFSDSKFNRGLVDLSLRLPVSDAQLRYEVLHLLKKLYIRSREWFLDLVEQGCFEPHPLFYVVPGDIEPWEKIPENFDRDILGSLSIGSYYVEIRICEGSYYR
ncbi:MAG: pyrimidine dimer DNA glycosylase/endonuclease V [Sulfolobales archaeon]